MMRENLFGMFRSLYRSAIRPVRKVRRRFYDFGEGVNYLINWFNGDLERQIDEYYKNQILNSFSDEIKSMFDITIKSPERIYLSRKSLETQVG